MGMLDNEAMLADGMAATAIGDTPSTNIYDTGGTNGDGDLGQFDERLWLNVCVGGTPAASGGAATIQGVIQVSDDGATWSDLVAGAVTPVANATTAYPLLRVQPPPIPVGNPSRYWRGVIRIAGAVLTSGTFDVYFSNTIERNIARASGFSVA